MACVKSVNRSASVAMAPDAPYMAAGTMAGAVDLSFSSSATLEIFKLDFQSDDRDLPVVGEYQSSERFNRLAWGRNGSGSEKYSMGLVAGGLVDGSIDVWDPLSLIRSEARESALVAHLLSHRGSVRGLEFNPFTPNLLASGADDGEIYIWDLAVPAEPSHFPPLRGPGSSSQGGISYVSWNTKVQHILASTSHNGITVVWDLKKQKPAISVEDSIRRRSSVLQWHPDVATQLVVASDDDSSPALRLWDMRNIMTPVKEFVGHTKGVIAMAWCPSDSTYLITCAKDNRTICWNTSTGEIVRELPAGTNWNFDVHWYPKIPGIIAASSFDGKIGIYNIEGCSRFVAGESDLGGGLKRRKAPGNFDRKNRSKKNRNGEEPVVRSPSPSSSDLSDEREPNVAVEEVVQKDSSMYDSLLMTLQSCNRSLASVYKNRQRQQEGKSDSEQEEVEDHESPSLSDEEDIVADGGVEISSKSRAVESRWQETSTIGTVDEDADTESEDSEASDTDQEQNGDGNTYSVETSTSSSSFHLHLGHNLSEAEAENLKTQKWKYKWKVPAFNLSNCNWVGTGECFLKDVRTNSAYNVKEKLYNHWLDVCKKSGCHDFHSSKQGFFFSLCNSYRDILHCNKRPFYHKGWEEDSSIMDAYIMHSLNHIFRTRDLVKKNEAKLAKQQESTKDELLASGAFLDHGFTRPKVLILLPFRSIALRVVKRLLHLTPPAYRSKVEYSDRFFKEYGAEDEDENEGSNNQAENVENSGSRKSSKPSDYQALFGGNCDDAFMIGIKFTKKSIKLYNDFYSSDVIVASPLQLHAKIEEAEVDKEKDVDYLSSIEVLVVDHADVITMQNWSFLNSVLEQLNRIPSKQHGTDIMRIRKWYLDGFARFYRQSIILGYYVNPDINASFSRLCSNFQGKVKLSCEPKGVLPKVLLQVRQIYERFDANLVTDVDDARLDYFINKVFPKIRDSVQGGIMLFTSSYFEFVRLRNFLKSQNASFCMIGDYTEQSDISRARVWFFEGKRKIMLYTERAHFYHRYKIRGIQNLIIYSLPERKEFYPEIVNMLDGSDDMTCTVLFSRFDQLRLERIVGAAPARKMLSSEKSVFAFC